VAGNSDGASSLNSVSDRGNVVEPESEIVSLEGPIELFGDQLALRIPLEAGGDQLVPITRGIGFVEEGCLIVIIQPWLARELNVSLGSFVVVDNRNGKFTISRSETNEMRT
jgi:hypothetical protein